MRALAATGDRVAAIRHARIHDQLVTQELGTGASPALAALAEQFRTELETAATPGPVAAMPRPAATSTVAPSIAPTAAPAVVQQPVSDASAPLKRWSQANVVRATAAIDTLAAVALAISMRPRAPGRWDDADLRALRISAPQRIASDDVFEPDAAISPDGRQVAYVAGEEGDGRELAWAIGDSIAERGKAGLAIGKRSQGALVQQRASKQQACTVPPKKVNSNLTAPSATHPL